MNRLWNFKIDHMPTGDGFQLPLLLTARPLLVQGVETWEYILHISVSLLLKKVIMRAIMIEYIRAYLRSINVRATLDEINRMNVWLFASDVFYIITIE